MTRGYLTILLLIGSAWGQEVCLFKDGKPPKGWVEGTNYCRVSDFSNPVEQLHDITMNRNTMPSCECKLPFCNCRVDEPIVVPAIQVPAESHLTWMGQDFQECSNGGTW